jgi:hypothetical protein
MMANYSLYIDAAGDPYTDFMVAGGFIANREAWLRFEGEWNDCLARNHLGNVFHMTDFEHEHRNNPQRPEILAELIDVIGKNLRAVIGSSVSIDDYRKINNHYPLEECIGKPYSLVARGTASNLQRWKRRVLLNEPVLVFAEDGTLHGGDMCECFVRDGLRPPVPVPKESPPVQAADLYCWETFNFKGTGIIRNSAKRLIMHFPIGIRRMDGDYSKRTMINSLKVGNYPARKDLPQDVRISFHTAPKKKRIRKIE